MDNLVEWLKKHWFLITAFFAVSVAYGQSTIKIQTLEDAVKESANTTREIKEIRSQVDRTDERTKSLLESQARQERMIELLLSSQRQDASSRNFLNEQLKERELRNLNAKEVKEKTR